MLIGMLRKLNENQRAKPSSRELRGEQGNGLRDPAFRPQSAKPARNGGRGQRYMRGDLVRGQRIVGLNQIEQDSVEPVDHAHDAAKIWHAAHENCAHLAMEML
ncbi:hypothetical protein [Sphingomonas sp. HDW15A]|uniref:hypothetical protein n=1 Tax=Sphingomonas sp. HDW15A TaxID=2714942 RepID=UPI001F0E190E|nr:hypothetical protein [Sphingomonas sp. HDW15A]